MHQPIDPPPFDWRAFAKRTIEDHIWDARGDRTEMKARIMIAFKDGHLTPQEVDDYIATQGLESD